MEKIIVFYLYQNLFVAKVKIETKKYISFECLYPFQKIRGDYFNDDADFYNDESLPLIKACLFSNFDAYNRFNRNKEYLLQELQSKGINSDSKDFEKFIKNYVLGEYKDIDFSFSSQQSFNRLLSNIAKFARNGQHCFEYIEELQNEEKSIETMLKIVLEQKINSVMFFKYEDDKFTGLNCTKKINLKTETFPDEMLLQELYRCKFSVPRLWARNPNPFLNEYFSKRFQTFDDQKKIGLFMHCNVDRSLFLYNKCLTTWWMNRY